MISGFHMAAFEKFIMRFFLVFFFFSDIRLSHAPIILLYTTILSTSGSVKLSSNEIAM